MEPCLLSIAGQAGVPCGRLLLLLCLCPRGLPGYVSAAQALVSESRRGCLFAVMCLLCRRREAKAKQQAKEQEARDQ
jgi:hypothetical protein